MRGNHDAYRGQLGYAGDQWIELPGLDIALLDTTHPDRHPGRTSVDRSSTGSTTGWRTPAERCCRVTTSSGSRAAASASIAASTTTSGSIPTRAPPSTPSVPDIPNVIGYAAGHTHRHRVRRMVISGAPSIEVGCVKDFPGTWAEYRVYEGGVMQVVHRISDPAALRWSNRCRVLYRDFGDRLRAVRDGRARRSLLRDAGRRLSRPTTVIPAQRGSARRCHTP